MPNMAASWKAVLTADISSISRMTPMSHQSYGPLVGVPRILALLKRHGVTATFFIPGYSAHRYPDVVRAVWCRIPPEMALKIVLKAKEIVPERINPDDMLPYLSHMTHVDFPMFLKMLRAAGEAVPG